jgi:hypothetical protein
MGALALPLLVGTAVVSTVGSIDQSRRARKASKAQSAAEQRRADIENVYKTRQAVRQARLAQGSMVNAAAQTGGMGGTGLAGGVSSVSSQLGGNLAFMESVAQENNIIVGAQNTINKSQTNAAVFGAVGQLGQTIFSPYLKAPKKEG